jgi:hypothetical protein
MNQILADGLARIVQELSDALSDHGFDVAAVQQALEGLGTLPVVTDEDRRVVLLAYLTLLDIGLKQVSEEAAAPLRTQRAGFQEAYDRLFGSQDTVYLSAGRVVQQLADGLGRDLHDDTLMEQALSDVGELPFEETDTDRSIAMGAMVQVLALGAAQHWLRGAGQDEAQPPVTAIDAIVRDASASMEAHGLDLQHLLSAAERVSGGEDQDGDAVKGGLLELLGLGLLRQPDAGPGLEPLRDRVIALMADGAEEAPAPTPAPAGDFTHRVDAILGQYARQLDAEGVNAYHFQEAMTLIKALQTETADENRALLAGLIRLIDLTLPRATKDVSDTLLVVRAQLVDAPDADAGGPLTADEIRAEWESVRADAQARLEGGAAVEPVVTAAVLKLRALSERLPDDHPESLQVLLQAMFVDFVAKCYVPTSRRGSSTRGTTWRA